jgi:hypothetical protein
MSQETTNPFANPPSGPAFNLAPPAAKNLMPAQGTNDLGALASASLTETVDPRHELLGQMLDNAGYMTYASRGSRGFDSDGNVSGERLRDWQHSTSQIRKELVDDFARAGITEVVTISESSVPYGRVNPKSLKPHEPVTVLTYETMSNGVESTSKYPYEDAFGRNGASFYMNLYLPQSDAITLLGWLREQPTLIRDAAATVMQRLETNGRFRGESSNLPPYDKWRKINNGVERLAIRKSFYATPEQSVIVETTSSV